VSLGALAVVLALFTLTAHNKVAVAVTIFLIGALGFTPVPPLQKGVLDQAAGAPTLASAADGSLEWFHVKHGDTSGARRLLADRPSTATGSDACGIPGPATRRGGVARASRRHLRSGACIARSPSMLASR
jgi:hypothetical protein